jgi:FixJ family two-component response regulator
MTPTVFVVDDDAALREALVQLLEAAGLHVESHPDGEAFLAAYEPGRSGCLLLDVAMPGMTGLEVQAELERRGNEIPVVFLTGHGDIPMAVRAVQAGAVDFLQKPMTGAALLERVRRALALDLERRHAKALSREIAERAGRLSPRERQVMALVVAGSSSKEVARLLGISVRTVEAHRTHVMHKMGATNLAELVAMAVNCDLGPPPASIPLT